MLDDEALRGDLEDAAWQPIQDWLLANGAALAASTAGLGDFDAEPRLQAGRAALRETALALSHTVAADTGDEARQRLEAVRHLLRPPVFDPTLVPRVDAALRALARRQVADGWDREQLAVALVGALRAGDLTARENA